MLDKYLEFKGNYPNSIIMIKAGSFYECLNDDAIVMKNIFNYKIVKLNKYIRAGFPLVRMNYVTSILTKLEINYIMLDDNITKEKFSNNKYQKYKYIDDKLYLNDNTNNPKIVDILDEIKKVCKIIL